jgi:hypothetical protein
LKKSNERYLLKIDRIPGSAQDMKKPHILPIVADIVKSGISAVDGVTFSGHTVCPACGGPLTGYDIKRKQFAHVITKNGPEVVHVSIRRYYCRKCHHLSLADNPFYLNTRIGSVVIDLCIALSMTMPVNRVPSYLAAMGVLVDRGSCRLYVQNDSSYFIRNNLRYIDPHNIFGVHLPQSVLTLSALAIDPDLEGPVEDSRIIAACGYPSRQRTSAYRPFPLKDVIFREDPGY